MRSCSAQKNPCIFLGLWWNYDLFGIERTYILQNPCLWIPCNSISDGLNNGFFMKTFREEIFQFSKKNSNLEELSFLKKLYEKINLDMCY